MAVINEYKDILNIYIPDNFGPDEEDFDGIIPEDFQTVFDQLDASVQTKWGISQFVIMKREWDKVVKIGFRGWYLWDNDREDTYFQEYFTNYADKAFNLYEEAEEWGIAPIFAGMELLGSNGSYNVYLQERVKCDFAEAWATGDVNRVSSDNSRTYVESKMRTEMGIWRNFDLNWLAQAVDCYGKELVEDTMAFLREHRIYDFHDGNYGYREDGTPVIIDWADFEQ